MRASTHGFTVIEVMLFLAISGLLLMMVLVGTGSMAARQRFTDTTDSFHAYVASQYDEVVNGVNTRGTASSCQADLPVATSQPGASRSCMLLGRLLTLGGSTVTSRVIISNNRLTGLEVGDAAKLHASTLMAIDDQMSTHELKWDAAITGATRSTSPYPTGSGRGSVDSIAFIRMPDSGRLVQLYYRNSVPGNPSQGLVFAIDHDTNAFDPAGTPTSPSLAVCLGNANDFIASNPRSAIFFAQGSGSGTITTNYNPGSVLCP